MLDNAVDSSQTTVTSYVARGARIQGLAGLAPNILI